MVPKPAQGTAVHAGLAFAREAVRSFRATGAIAPSSRRLCARLALPIGSVPHPATVLEVGAGTGVVTRALAARLGPADRLDAVEVNPRFAAMLRTALVTDPVLAAVADRVRVIPESITAMRLDRRYDAIISGLPFMNFDPAEVQDILDRYMAALVPGGQLRLYGYLGTRVAGRLVGSRAEVARQQAVGAVLADFEGRYGWDRTVVWSNLPPARIRYLRAPAPDRRDLGRAADAG
ncbi:MAG TPA: methyltransferase domain-containing protein [Mycobacteriales bacterium]|jgi:phosphatidylethanolamine/phosphatidyl-N-methylethanolamine N-methyltransferase|nr:methyltransferase domain-containing protein [Mycobacteriales bacterium]